MENTDSNPKADEKRDIKTSDKSTFFEYVQPRNEFIKTPTSSTEKPNLHFVVTGMDDESVPAEDRLIYVTSSGVMDGQYHCYNHTVPVFPDLYKPRGMCNLSKKD
jgi:hypothetical protein